MKILSVVLLILISGCQKSADRLDASFCYEPCEVSIAGIIQEREAFGPPSYGENKNIDTMETFYVLVARMPFSVKGDSTSDLNTDSIDDIREVQLILDSESTMKKAITEVGHEVRMKGTLSQAISGHHHTMVLLHVNMIE